MLTVPWIESDSSGESSGSDAVHFSIFVDVDVSAFQLEQSVVDVGQPQLLAVVTTQGDQNAEAWVCLACI